MTTTESIRSLTVFVTGGSGFLGVRILKQLLAQGHRVRAMARSDAAAQRIAQAGAEVVRGDLGAVDALDLQGVDAVVHAAAPVVFWGPWAMYQREVVDASLALYRHAARQGVRRFVYISSESVLQGKGELIDIDDAQPMADPPNSDYGRAKKAAELALGEAHRQSPACALIILRPTFIWAEDAPAVQLLKHKIRQGQFMWIAHGARPFEAVHVDNVASAVSCALLRGEPGEPYLVTDGQPYTARSLLTALVQSGADAVTAPAKSLPSAVARPLAALVEGLWRLLRIWNAPPPISRFDVAFMSQGRRYRIDRAERDLGYRPLKHAPDGGETAT